MHTWNVKDTVDKLNKSKLIGNINVNKMVLLLVSCWWCFLCLFLWQLTTMSSTPAVAEAVATVEAEKANAALVAAGAMTVMSNDDDDNNDGHKDDG